MIQHSQRHYLTRTANYTAECVSIFNVMNTSSSMLCTKFIQNSSKQTTLLFVDQNKLDGLCLELFKTRTLTITHWYIQTHTNSFALYTESKNDKKNHLTKKMKKKEKNKMNLNVCRTTNAKNALCAHGSMALVWHFFDFRWMYECVIRFWKSCGLHFNWFCVGITPISVALQPLWNAIHVVSLCRISKQSDWCWLWFVLHRTYKYVYI